MTELRTPYARGANREARRDRLATAYADAMGDLQYARAAKVRRAWWRLVRPSDSERWQRIVHA
jgi:hypothetical protein